MVQEMEVAEILAELMEEEEILINHLVLKLMVQGMGMVVVEVKEQIERVNND